MLFNATFTAATLFETYKTGKMIDWLGFNGTFSTV